MAISIKGVIGYDVNGQEFSERLKKLTGDIEFEIDSPGGSVFHGISIFNAIKNYNRGKKRIHVVGDCSSMAAYIMLAGDTLEFEPNSIVCLHNPWNVAMGDYQVMKKNAELLEDLAALYAKKFVEKGIFEEKEIRQIMDEETWFIGAERLKLLGTVLDTEYQEEDGITEEIKIAASTEKMENAKAVVKSLKEESFDMIAALIPQAKIQANTKIIQEKGEINMNTLQELKAQKPELYAQAIETGSTEGTVAERRRVSSLLNFIDVDKEATVNAIINGKNVNDDEFQSAILMAKIKTAEINAMENENPPAVDPQEEIHEPEDGAEDDEAAKAKKEEETFNNIMERMNLK